MPTPNYVTLVANGGTPIRIADQRGTPYPTTGTGSLVFADDAVLNNPTLNGFTIDPSFPITVTTLTVLGDLNADSGVVFGGGTSGSTRVIADTVASGVLTLPAATTTLVGRTTADTLTNKTISGSNNTFLLIPVTALNDGTSASATTFWRGDGTWATPAGAAVSIGVGTTTVTGGTSGRVLYDNAGVLDQMTNTGTGTVNVLQDSPTLITPDLGVATATSLAIGGATLGAHALAVTGTVLLNDALTYGGVTLNNAVTGTGDMVLSASPTLSGTVGGALTFSGALTLSAALTYGGVTLANSVTGTGSMVLSADPTLTGTTTVSTLTVGTLATGPGTLSNLAIRVQTFSASGTYTPHASMVYCVMEGVGGGGGGGGSAIATTGGQLASGGGGGGGEYACTVASRATIGASQVVTIGAAGTAGTAGANNGGAGGNTSVGALLVANGGSLGVGGSASGSTMAVGGLGGTGGTGTIVVPGGAGGNGVTFTDATPSNYGGSSRFGAGGRSSTTFNGGAGTAGVGFGAGGAGGRAANGGAAAAGGAGTTGYVVVTEYCTA